MNKFCIAYVSRIELSNASYHNNIRTISLLEGVPQRYTFSPKYPFIFFAYHIIDFNNTLVSNFNLIDKTYLLVNIFIEDKILKSQKIFKNSQIYLYTDDFKNFCSTEEACTIIIECRMQNSTIEKNIIITAY